MTHKELFLSQFLLGDEIVLDEKFQDLRKDYTMMSTKPKQIVMSMVILITFFGLATFQEEIQDALHSLSLIYFSRNKSSTDMIEHLN